MRLKKCRPYVQLKKNGKFKSVAPKRKVAKTPHRFDRHQAEIMLESQYSCIFQELRNRGKYANMDLWVKYALGREKVPAFVESHLCSQHNREYPFPCCYPLCNKLLYFWNVSASSFIVTPYHVCDRHFYMCGTLDIFSKYRSLLQKRPIKETIFCKRLFYVWSVCHTILCGRHSMGWLRLVGSIQTQVSFAKETYKRDDILQKRLMIWRSLLIVATPYETFYMCVTLLDILYRHCICGRHSSIWVVCVTDILYVWQTLFYMSGMCSICVTDTLLYVWDVWQTFYMCDRHCTCPLRSHCARHNTGLFCKRDL